MSSAAADQQREPPALPQQLMDLTEGPFALAPTWCPSGELPAALAEHASTTDACVLCAEDQGQGPWQCQALLPGEARHICPEGH